MATTGYHGQASNWWTRKSASSQCTCERAIRHWTAFCFSVFIRAQQLVFFFITNHHLQHLLWIFYLTLSSFDTSIFSDLVLVGDFNIDVLCQSHYYLSCILDCFSFSQVNSIPTHCSQNGHQTLALLSSPEHLPSCETVSLLGSSDHFLCGYVPKGYLTFDQTNCCIYILINLKFLFSTVLVKYPLSIKKVIVVVWCECTLRTPAICAHRLLWI